MKTLLTTTLVALTLSSNVFALETSVVPKVTELQTKNPTSRHLGSTGQFKNVPRIS